MAVTAGASMAHALLDRLAAEDKLDDRLRYEILDGELVIRGAPSVRHEEVVAALLSYLGPWVREHGGKALAGAGIEVGGHQLMPDLSFIGPDRVDELHADGFHVAPDLVVEVTSPGTRSLDLTEKRRIYAEIGVVEYWVVDLAISRVLIHRRDAAGAYQATERTDGTLATPAVPGLELPIGELLATG